MDQATSDIVLWSHVADVMLGSTIAGVVIVACFVIGVLWAGWRQ